MGNTTITSGTPVMDWKILVCQLDGFDARSTKTIN
jgi:hypothetical protein